MSGLCGVCNYLFSPSPVFHCFIVMLLALVFSLVKTSVSCLGESLLAAEKQDAVLWARK